MAETIMYLTERFQNSYFSNNLPVTKMGTQTNNGRAPLGHSTWHMGRWFKGAIHWNHIFRKKSVLRWQHYNNNRHAQKSAKMTKNIVVDQALHKWTWTSFFRPCPHGNCSIYAKPVSGALTLPWKCTKRETITENLTKHSPGCHSGCSLRWI